MKKYFFAVYDDKDRIISTFENYNELLDYFVGKKYDTLRHAIYRDERIRYKENWYKIYKVVKDEL